LPGPFAAPGHHLARRWVAALAVACGCCLVGTAAAADLFVGSKSDRPDGEAGPYQRQTFPCDDPRQDLPLEPGLELVFADTTGGQSAVDAYACRPGWAETGPEHIYRLEAGTDLILVAMLQGNDPVDHDLILLADCHTDSCLVQDNTELSGILRAGRTYYLIVDGYQEAAGPYHLTLRTYALGVPPSICEPGGAVPVDVATAGATEFTGNLHEQSDQLAFDHCATVTVAGGEVWYALSLEGAVIPDQDTEHGAHLRVVITATTGAGSLDLALWLYDGCGPDAVCLAFADQGNAGQSETLTWENETADPVTLYLAVDCLQAPDDPLFGDFTLLLNATVGSERRSFTDVRSLFR